MGGAVLRALLGGPREGGGQPPRAGSGLRAPSHADVIELLLAWAGTVFPHPPVFQVETGNI